MKHLYSKPFTALPQTLQAKEKRSPSSEVLILLEEADDSSLMMLRHMSLNDHADRIEKAIFDTLAEGKSITGDLGGKASTGDYTKAIVSRIK